MWAPFPLQAPARCRALPPPPFFPPHPALRAFESPAWKLDAVPLFGRARALRRAPWRLAFVGAPRGPALCGGLRVGENKQPQGALPNSADVFD